MSDDLSAQVNQQRLEAECAKLDPQEEQEFAELGIEEFLGMQCTTLVQVV